MKFSLSVISLLACFSLAVAGRQPECPTICPAVYAPVCAEAKVGGRLLRCQFENSCRLSSSACVHRINWQPAKCEDLSCKKLCDKYTRT